MRTVLHRRGALALASLALASCSREAPPQPAAGPWIVGHWSRDVLGELVEGAGGKPGLDARRERALEAAAAKLAVAYRFAADGSVVLEVTSAGRLERSAFAWKTQAEAGDELTLEFTSATHAAPSARTFRRESDSTMLELHAPGRPWRFVRVE